MMNSLNKTDGFIKHDNLSSRTDDFMKNNKFI